MAAITESSYGRWLLVKLAVVAGVVVAAAVSRRLLHRQIAPASVPARLGTVGAAATDTGSGDDRALERTVALEVAGMVVVLAATAGLTGATPPLDAPSTPVDVSVSAVADDHVAQIDLLPAVTGGTTMHVTITAPDTSPDPADEISVLAALPEQDLGPIDIETMPAGPDHVTTDAADFPIPGRWTITVTARYGEFDQLVFDAEVDVTGG